MVEQIAADVHDGELLDLVILDGSRPAPLSEPVRTWTTPRNHPVRVKLSVLDAISAAKGIPVAVINTFMTADQKQGLAWLQNYITSTQPGLTPSGRTDIAAAPGWGPGVFGGGLGQFPTSQEPPPTTAPTGDTLADRFGTWSTGFTPGGGGSVTLPDGTVVQVPDFLQVTTPGTSPLQALAEQKRIKGP